MVPSPVPSSNGVSQLLAEWNKQHKQGLTVSEIAHHRDIDKLFDTLADWNNYLENHVPYFQEPE